MLVKEGVFGESVVGDVGDPLKGPLLRLDDFRRDVGDLSDVTHRRGDSLGIQVRAY